MHLTCSDECVVVVNQFFTKAKIFSRPFRAERRLLGKSFNVCTIDAECYAIVVVHIGLQSVSSSEYNLTFCASIRDQYNFLSNLYTKNFTALIIHTPTFCYPHTPLANPS
uniref:Uncharacterized protein n=1 Tax=Hyaloperonospora arabidopsidis (strain Emoy2) TaxID=559515 RepID=M4BRH6_HYAAE